MVHNPPFLCIQGLDISPPSFCTGVDVVGGGGMSSSLNVNFSAVLSSGPWMVSGCDDTTTGPGPAVLLRLGVNRHIGLNTRLVLGLPVGFPDAPQMAAR